MKRNLWCELIAIREILDILQRALSEDTKYGASLFPILETLDWCIDEADKLNVKEK